MNKHKILIVSVIVGIVVAISGVYTYPTVMFKHLTLLLDILTAIRKGYRIYTLMFFILVTYA